MLYTVVRNLPCKLAVPTVTIQWYPMSQVFLLSAMAESLRFSRAGPCKHRCIVILLLFISCYGFIIGIHCRFPLL